MPPPVARGYMTPIVTFQLRLSRNVLIKWPAKRRAQFSRGSHERSKRVYVIITGRYFRHSYRFLLHSLLLRPYTFDKAALEYYSN